MSFDAHRHVLTFFLGLYLDADAELLKALPEGSWQALMAPVQNTLDILSSNVLGGLLKCSCW